MKNGTFVNNEFNDVYLVCADIDLATIKLQAEEVSEVAWVSFSELEKRISERDGSIVTHDDEYPMLYSVLHQRFDELNITL